MLFTIRNGGSLDDSIITHHVFSELGTVDIVVSRAVNRKSQSHSNPKYAR